MPNTPNQTPTYPPFHGSPTNPFGPIISTSIRSNNTLHQYYQYTPTAATPRQQDFLIDATHATKRKRAASEAEVGAGKKVFVGDIPSRRSRDDDEGIKRRKGSEASTWTLGKPDNSSSTMDTEESGIEGISNGDDDENMDMDMDGDMDKNKGGNIKDAGLDGEDDEGKGDRASEASSCTLGRSEDEDMEDAGDEEDGDESDDKGDVFAASYRNDSRK